MPITCTSHAPSTPAPRAHKVVVCQPQLIPWLLLPVNHEHLQRYCTDSLARICHEYCVSPDLPVVCHLRQCVSRLSFTNALALFFVLLNIDTAFSQQP